MQKNEKLPPHDPRDYLYSYDWATQIFNPEVEEPLYTVGANGYRIDKLTTVKALMNELTGKQNGITKSVETAGKESNRSIAVDSLSLG